MSLVYDESVRTGFRGFKNFHDMNPHKPYNTHLENWFYLKFIQTTSDRFQEKQQALKELDIAERKMTFWRRHPNFDVEVERKLIAACKKTWEGKFNEEPTREDKY